MKTKIINTFRQWAPETMKLIPELDETDIDIADYHLLKRMAEICTQKIQLGTEEALEQVEDIAKVVNLLYQSGNQFTRNAIENEFLTNLSLEESPASLKKQLELLPVELRKVYIKTIIEN